MNTPLTTEALDAIAAYRSTVDIVETSLALAFDKLIASRGEATAAMEYRAYRMWWGVAVSNLVNAGGSL